MSSTQDTSVGESMGNCQQRVGEKQRVALGLEKTAHGLWAGPLGTLLQPSCLETQGGLRSVLTGTWLVTGTLFHWTQIDFFLCCDILSSTQHSSQHSGKQKWTSRAGFEPLKADNIHNGIDDMFGPR